MTGRRPIGTDNGDTSPNFTHFAEFASKEDSHYALSLVEEIETDSWILDTRTSKHVPNNIKLMSNLTQATSHISVFLPDETQ